MLDFLLFGHFAFALGKKLLLWAFWCRKVLEGKRIVEGKNY
jgi:hypothetical protein